MNPRPTRERLLDAAERIIRERGIMAVTTKDIARETGLAEATLYRHFPDKTELLLAVMNERLPVGSFLSLIRDLPQRAGEDSVTETLERIATAAVTFFAQIVPLVVALAADPPLAARHTARLHELGAGPDPTHAALAAYLRLEQRLGRVRAEASPAAATTLLLGVCFNYAQVCYQSGAHPVYPTPEQFVTEMVRTLFTGLAPAESHKSPDRYSDETR